MDDFLDVGEIALHELDDANVPMNIGIGPAEDDDRAEGKQWVLTASVFFPRRERVHVRAVRVYSDDRAALARRMCEVAVPLYMGAVRLLHRLGEAREDGCSLLYYWYPEEG